MEALTWIFIGLFLTALAFTLGWITMSALRWLRSKL